MLANFQVEELEQRLEMGKWEVSAEVEGSGTNGDWDLKYTGGIGYSW
ncbi:MAG: hypothetical protein HRT66_10025 [Flavobacteriaceae bacterium]|nr:hypothetical protein [Flavobacteriaceae bacterium]